MNLDLREADRGRKVTFEGDRHDGEEGNTLDYLSWTEDGDLIDHLPEMTRGYIDTAIGPWRRYVSQTILLRRIAERLP
jgi:hypothetical protein